MKRPLTPLLIALALFTWPAAASAHTPGANYRTDIARVTPTLTGVNVTAAADGSYIELTNRGTIPVIVYGYERDQYLKVGPDGVWQNSLSPATYLNKEETIGEIPAGTDIKAAPKWERIFAEPTVRWHDHRIHWMGVNIPPAASKAPDQPHLIKNWSIRAAQGETQITIDGTLNWVPSPAGAMTPYYYNYAPAILLLGLVALAGLALGGLAFTAPARATP